MKEMMWFICLLRGSLTRVESSWDNHPPYKVLDNMTKTNGTLYWQILWFRYCELKMSDFDFPTRIIFTILLKRTWEMCHFFKSLCIFTRINTKTQKVPQAGKKKGRKDCQVKVAFCWSLWNNTPAQSEALWETVWWFRAPHSQWQSALRELWGRHVKVLLGKFCHLVAVQATPLGSYFRRRPGS